MNFAPKFCRSLVSRCIIAACLSFLPVLLCTSQFHARTSVNKGFGIKITPNGIEPEDVISLDLKKLDETLKVAFGPDRIDIVSTQTNETWDSFCKTIIEISSIVNKIGMKYNRLALCANISYALDNGQGNLAYAKLTKMSTSILLNGKYEK